MSDSDSNGAVTEHYRRPDLLAAIDAALDEAGLDPAALSPEDLAPFDEFHVRGRAATAELAERAGLMAGMRVLDIGAGVGGPSRHLAATYGCRVTGIDLSADYCRVATALATRVGLSDRVSYRQGDATRLPFPDAAFDAAWTQHAAMNIADKATLYAEIRRVTKPGGVLALYDAVAGADGMPHFPVPWARRPDYSFLVTAAALRELLEGTGFAIESWRDVTEAGSAWFAAVLARVRDGGPRPLGIHLLLGRDFPEMARNMAANLAEGRVGLCEVVARVGAGP